MVYPNFREEKKLWKKGYEFVVGLDEAGRGPLAGPVVAAAVIMKIGNQKHSNILKNIRMFYGIKDAKKLSEKQREFFYKKLINYPSIEWGVGIVSEKIIDKINILEATKLAMLRAVNDLEIKPDFLILDGNFRIKSKIIQKPIVSADRKVFSCVAAGIIAKVTRDKLMRKLHKKYPKYGFNRHKGYGTKLHIRRLGDFGPCKIHRKTFWPVSSLVKNEII